MGCGVDERIHSPRVRGHGVTALTPKVACRLYLATLYSREPAAWIAIRERLPNGRGMRQAFHRTALVDELAPRLVELGQRTDVYVRATPCSTRDGTAASAKRAWTLYADCDTPDAVRRLAELPVPPPMTVRSGTETHTHAYWPLREPVAPEDTARANRRLAHALGADRRATDIARILRPPGTLNHKTCPPASVRLDAFDATGRSPLLTDIAGDLADPPDETRPSPAPVRTLPNGADDVLRTFPASYYVPALTGRDLGRDGKVACPFHEERTPSLHAYDDPDRGWCCYGCGRGGSIIDFGAELYGVEPRGAGYHEIRRRLAAELLRLVVA